MFLSSEAPDARCSRIAAIALALLVGLGSLPAPAADPSAPAGSGDGAQPPTEKSGDPTGEPAAQGTTPPAPPPQGIEVIRITGKAFTGIETEVPTSVTQFNPEDLAALGAQDVSDVARFTPSLEINTVSPTSPTFFIRGVGLNDFNANAAGAVAIYRDGVPINSPAIQLSGLFDVENVEILRGPQGWGDDRNASGGAIKTYTRKPDGNLEAFLNADYGKYNLRDFQGAVAAPIVEGVLSSRLAFRLTERDPFYDNGCGGVEATEEQRLPPPPPPQPPPPARRIRGSIFGPRFCNEALRGINNPRFGTQFPNPPGPAGTDFEGDPKSILVSPLPNGLTSEVNDVSSWGARAQLRFQPPGTEMDWLLNVHGGRIDHLSPLGVVVGTANGAQTGTGYKKPVVDQRFQQYLRAGFDSRTATRLTIADFVADIGEIHPFDNDYDLVGKEKQNSLGGFLRGDLRLGPVLVSTITGTEWYNRSRHSDFDFSSNPAIHIFQEDDSQQWTENLGFEWEHPEVQLRLRWGGYYLHEKLSADSTFLLDPIGAFPTVTDQSYEQRTGSLGAYANFNWDFLEDFTLEGGVRFNRERKIFDLGVSTEVFGFRVGGEPTEDEKTWSAPTGGLSLTYRFTEDLSAYWKYTHGWKAGHFNANVITLRNPGTGLPLQTVTPSAAEPETIDAFETGLRGQWLDGRLALGGSLFYYQYQNYQVFLIENQLGSPPQVQVINANDARVWGAEADLRAEPLAGWAPEPLEGLVLSARFGWLESEFLDFTNSRFQLVGGDFFRVVVVDYSGNRLPNTPRFKVSATAEYTFDLGRWGTVIPRYDFTWTDDVFFDPSEGRGSGDEPLPEYSTGQVAYGLHDVRLTYRPPMGSIEFSLWVRNIADKIYKTYVADVTAGGDVGPASLLNFIGDPRTYGLSVAFSF